MEPFVACTPQAGATTGASHPKTATRRGVTPVVSFHDLGQGPVVHRLQAPPYPRSGEGTWFCRRDGTVELDRTTGHSPGEAGTRSDVATLSSSTERPATAPGGGPKVGRRHSRRYQSAITLSALRPLGLDHKCDYRPEGARDQVSRRGCQGRVRSVRLGRSGGGLPLVGLPATPCCPLLSSFPAPLHILSGTVGVFRPSTAVFYANWSVGA
jgi:hypothetical protein